MTAKPTLTPIQREILLHGIRWANNILAELSNNYARSMPKEAAAHMRTVLLQLSECEQIIRTEGP
jgi:hypothetical protein